MTFERNVKGLLGTKLGMTQLWDENNKVVPVTVVAAASSSPMGAKVVLHARCVLTAR